MSKKIKARSWAALINEIDSQRCAPQPGKRLTAKEVSMLNALVNRLAG